MVTRNLQASTLFVLPYIDYQPADVSNNQPALDAANLVKQTIVGAPFAWPWNRFFFSVQVTKEAGQDYLIVPSFPGFGYLEKAWLLDENDEVKQISIQLSLTQESKVQRPASIAAMVQYPDGSVLLRLNTIPDMDYTLRGFYQGAPVPMTSMASTWNPIPDNLSYIYDWGYLSLLGMLIKDQRVPYFGQRFVAHLLGNQSGLSATQRNIFIGNWLELIRDPLAAQAKTQQSVAIEGAM